MSVRNFLVHTAACFIPNREKRKAFRRRYRLPETAELLRGRVTVLEETAKKLEDKVKYLQQKEKEYAEAERIKAEERDAHKEFAELTEREINSLFGKTAFPADWAPERGGRDLLR